MEVLDVDNMETNLVGLVSGRGGNLALLTGSELGKVTMIITLPVRVESAIAT